MSSNWQDQCRLSAGRRQGINQPEGEKANDTLRKCADLTEGLLAVPRDELNKKLKDYEQSKDADRKSG